LPCASTAPPEQFFDESEKSRFIQVRLKIDLSIRIKIGASERIVVFEKGDYLRVCRVRHFDKTEIANIFEGNGFDVIQHSISQDQEFALLIAKEKTIKTSPGTRH
jgi:uncharacterized SAM-dependent methyltransferase